MCAPWTKKNIFHCIKIYTGYLYQLPRLYIDNQIIKWVFMLLKQQRQKTQTSKTVYNEGRCIMQLCVHLSWLHMLLSAYTRLQGHGDKVLSITTFNGIGSNFFQSFTYWNVRLPFTILSTSLTFSCGHTLVWTPVHCSPFCFNFSKGTVGKVRQ